MRKPGTEFGRIVRKARLGKGFTLRELAGLTGKSHPYLSDIETGRRVVTEDGTLEAICDALEIDDGAANEAVCRDMGELRAKLGDGADRDRILLALARMWARMDDGSLSRTAEFLENLEEGLEKSKDDGPRP